jgi:hypothetical protein
MYSAASIENCHVEQPMCGIVSCCRYATVGQQNCTSPRLVVKPFPIPAIAHATSVRSANLSRTLRPSPFPLHATVTARVLDQRHEPVLGPVASLGWWMQSARGKLHRSTRCGHLVACAAATAMIYRVGVGRAYYDHTEGNLLVQRMRIEVPCTVFSL